MEHVDKKRTLTTCLCDMLLRTTYPPTEWPGLHCAWNYAAGEWTVNGHWDDQTKAYRMREAGKRVRRMDYRQAESFDIDPLPCWEHLDRSVATKWVRERLEMIREEYRDLKFLGLRKLAAQSIDDMPLNSARTPAPMFHCKNRERWVDMRNAYRDFVKQFYSASARLSRLMRAEKEPYYFPSGCHPPLPPVVAESA